MMPDRRPTDAVPDGRGAFHCGWLLDGSGAAARRDMVMTVADGRILEIFPAGAGCGGLVPADWRAFTILPPLVDAHVHLFLSGRGDPGLRRRQLDLEPNQSLDDMLKRTWRHLRRGILAVRDAGDGDALALTLRDRSKDLFPTGFVLRASGKAWHRAGRYGRVLGRSPAPGQSLTEAVAGDLEAVDQVKIINSGINRLTAFGAPSKPQFDAADLKAAVAIVHGRDLPVMVHANGDQPVADALAAGCDSIEHGFCMGEANLAQMAEQQVVWVPTACAMAGCIDCFAAGSPEADGARRYLDHQLSRLRRARELGVVVALGTDAGSPGVRHGKGMRVEMALLAAAGYPAGEVVECAAANGAKLLHLERHGILRPGAPADFVAVPGPPDVLFNSLDQVAAVYYKGSPVTVAG